MTFDEEIRMILDTAGKVPWYANRNDAGRVRVHDGRQNHTIALCRDAFRAAYPQAIAIAVNAYARDRELLAMARDALRRMHRAAVISVDGVVRCLVCGMNYRGEERHGGNCAAGFAQQVLAALGTEA